MTAPPPCVVGVGNAWRRDDGVGLEVVRRLRERVDASIELLECHGDLTGLLLQWRDRPLVIVVDAMVSGAAAGTIRRFESPAAPGTVERVVPPGAAPSTHAVGLAQAVALATQLDLLPRRLTCFAVEAGCTDHGSGLSPPVAAAVEPLIARIVDELHASNVAVTGSPSSAG